MRVMNNITPKNKTLLFQVIGMAMTITFIVGLISFNECYKEYKIFGLNYINDHIFNFFIPPLLSLVITMGYLHIVFLNRNKIK